MVRPFDAPVLRYFLLWMVGLVTLYFLVIQLMTRDSPPINPIAGDLLTQVIAFLPFIWFMLKSMDGSMPLRYYVRPDITSLSWLEIILVTLAWVLFSIGADGLFGYGLSWLAPGYLSETASLKIFESDSRTSMVILTFLIAGVVAPVMEELVFRGLIFQRLMVRTGAAKAIVISSLLFGLLHLEGWMGASIFAVLMCLLYLHTNNILVPIVLHILNNLISLALEYAIRSQEAVADIGLIRKELALSLLCLLAFPWMIKTLRKYWPQRGVPLPYYHNQGNLN